MIKGRKDLIKLRSNCRRVGTHYAPGTICKAAKAPCLHLNEVNMETVVCTQLAPKVNNARTLPGFNGNAEKSGPRSRRIKPP